MELVAHVHCMSKFLSKFDVLNLLESKLSSKFETSNLLESKLGAGEQAGTEELQFETNLATFGLKLR